MKDLILLLIGTILGSGLTYVGGWLLIYREKAIESDNRKKLFTKAIIHDLNASIPLYEMIKNDWKKTKKIWFEHTIELKEHRKIYKNYLENTLLYSDDVRKKFFDYYIKTDTLISLLESLENRKQFLHNQYWVTFRAVQKEKPVKIVKKFGVILKR